jgi:hypothetical protein
MRMNFSLKTFLVAIGIAATCCGAARLYVLDVCARADRHDLAIKRLEGLGLWHDALEVFVGSSKNLPTHVQLARKWIHPHAYPEAYYIIFGEPGHHLQFGDWKWGDLREHVSELKHLQGLRYISGNIHSISLAEAKHFGAMKDIEDIRLTITGKIEPGALAEFAKYPKLKKLSLFAQIDRSFIEATRNSRSLESVCINGVNMTPELMQILCDSHSIKTLCISNLEANEEMLRPLRKLKNLEYLRLSDSQFTAEGIDHLTDLSVRSLSLDSHAELPVPVSIFAKMEDLEELSISAKAPRKAGDIASFENPPRLRRLSIHKLIAAADSIRALGKNMQLRFASLDGEAPKEVAIQFAEGGLGRWLYLYKENKRDSKDGDGNSLMSWPKMYEGKNCSDLEAVFPSSEDE